MIQHSFIGETLPPLLDDGSSDAWSRFIAREIEFEWRENRRLGYAGRELTEIIEATLGPLLAKLEKAEEQAIEAANEANYSDEVLDEVRDDLDEKTELLGTTKRKLEEVLDDLK